MKNQALKSPKNGHWSWKSADIWSQRCWKIAWSSTSVVILKLGRCGANYATNYMYNLVLQFVMGYMICWSNRTVTFLDVAIDKQVTLYVVTHCLFICPIAIAYSMGQIIKSVCVCQSVCVSVRVSSLSRSHFFVDFYQIWHRGVNPQK